jgi:prevent-host-death family protein
MNLALEMTPLHELKNNPNKLFKKLHQTSSPVIITKKGKPEAVLQDIESYKEQQSYLIFLKLMFQSEKDYQTGKTLSHSEAIHHFEEKFQNLKKSSEK